MSDGELKMGKIVEFVKHRLESVINDIKKMDTLTLCTLVTCVAFDTLCIYVLAHYSGLGWYFAFPLGILAAVVLDLFSYFGSFYGLGQIIKIPKFLKLHEIKGDLITACLVCVIMVVGIVFFQGWLIVLRHEQIKDNEKQKYEFEIEIGSRIFQSNAEMQKYIKENDLKPVVPIEFPTNEERQEYIRNMRPRYFFGGNKTFDWFTLIIPIITTIASFIIGLIKTKPYDRFEKKIYELKTEIEKNKKPHRDEIARLQKMLDEGKTKFDVAIYEYRRHSEEEINKLEGKAGEYVREIQAFGGDIIGIREPIQMRKEKPTEYEILIRKLNKQLERVAPNKYKSQIDLLSETLKRKGSDIYKDVVRGNARNISNITVFTKCFLTDKYLKEFNEIADLDENGMYKENELKVFFKRDRSEVKYEET